MPRSLRRLLLWGGPAWLRWLVRLILLAGIALLGWIPYRHEVGGDCRVAPGAQVSVRSQIEGEEVLGVFVREGERVEVGSPIAALAMRKDLAAVATCKAALQHAQAELDLLVAGPRAEDIAIAEQKVALWQAQVVYAEKQLTRIKALQKKDSASLRELDDAEKARAAAAAELLSARENLEKLRAGYRPERIRAAQADVERCRAELAYHEERVRLGRITAPISGNVVTANVRERVGQSVATGDLIAVIHDASPPQVEVFTEEPDAAQVEEGMHVHVRLWGSQGRLLTGRVRKVNRATEEYAAFHIERIRSDREELAKASADREPNRRLRICVDLDPPAEPVVPGMTGYARIVLEDGLFWQALARPVLRFFRVEVWSWLP